MVPSMMDAYSCPSPSPVDSPGGPDELYRHPPVSRNRWPGWTNLAGQQQALQCARVSELYAALHRHYMLSCPFERLESGTRVLISWMWEPTAQQAVVDVKFKSPAEVAAELADLRRGKVDNHRSNEGGILHFVGDKDLFWSSIIYWHMHGTCMPISYAELGFKVPRPPSAKPPPEDAGPRMRRLNERLSRSSKSPDSEGESALRPRRIPFPDLPPGWQDARRAWDKALARAARVGYSAHCMFFCTEEGCAANEHCALRHDDKRRQWCAENAAQERSRGGPPPRPVTDAYDCPPWEEPALAPPRNGQHQLRRSWPGQQGVGASSQQVTYVLSQRVID